jgi:hypothetical protein
MPAFEPSVWGPGQPGSTLAYVILEDSPIGSDSFNFGFNYNTNSIDKVANSLHGFFIDLVVFEDQVAITISNGTNGEKFILKELYDTEKKIYPMKLNQYDVNSWGMHSVTYESSTQLFSVRSYAMDTGSGQLIKAEKIWDLTSYNWIYAGGLPKGLWQIGRDVTGSEAGLTGEVDEFCVYDKALNNAELQTIFSGGCKSTANSNLKVYYTFDNDRSNALPNVFNEVHYFIFLSLLCVLKLFIFYRLLKHTTGFRRHRLIMKYLLTL